MPVVLIKAVPALLALVFSLSFLIPHGTPTYKTVIDINGQRVPVILYVADKDKTAGVRVVYKKSGKDVTLFYDRKDELTDFDRQVVENLIEEIKKDPKLTDQIREWFQDGLKGIVRTGINGGTHKKTK